MAVTVGNISSSSGNITDLIWAHTIAAGTNKVLIVGVALAAGESVSTVIWDNGGGEQQTLTNIHTQQNTGSVRTELWYAVGGVSGTKNITVTCVTKARLVAGGVDFSGATTPDNATGREEDAATSSSLTITAAGDDDYLVDMLAEDANQNATQGADQAEYVDIASHASISGAGSTQDGAVTGDVMSWSFGSADIAHSACRIPAAAVVRRIFIV
jgi:hypothetical protein